MNAHDGARAPKPRRGRVFGCDMCEQGLVEMWPRRLDFAVSGNIVNDLRHADPATAHLEVPRVAEVAGASRPRVDGFLSQLDTELSGRTFVAGGDVSVAATAGLFAVDLMNPAELAVHERPSNVARWRAARQARPSAVA